MDYRGVPDVAHSILVHAFADLETVDGQIQTSLRIPSLEVYDSSYNNPWFRDNQAAIIAEIKRTLDALRWLRGPGIPIDSSISVTTWTPEVMRWTPDRVVASSQQLRGSNTCGVHCVLNAWCVALGVDINVGFQANDGFYAQAVDVIGLALEGRLSSEQIKRFLACSGYGSRTIRYPIPTFDATTRTGDYATLRGIWERVLKAEDDMWNSATPTPENSADLETAAPPPGLPPRARSGGPPFGSVSGGTGTGRVLPLDRADRLIKDRLEALDYPVSPSDSAAELRIKWDGIPEDKKAFAFETIPGPEP